MMVDAARHPHAQPGAVDARACPPSSTAAPFANIAHGCNSVIATKHGHGAMPTGPSPRLALASISAPRSSSTSSALSRRDSTRPTVVLVATVRALKRHGGVAKADLDTPDAAAVERGLDNLRKHVESIQTFGKVPVVALNRFATDGDEEIDVVRRACADLEVPFAVADHFAQGGAGGEELAQALVDHASDGSKPFNPLYQAEDSLKKKMRQVARFMYGATEVAYTKQADKDLAQLQELGYGGLPLCCGQDADLADRRSESGRQAGGLRDHRARLHRRGGCRLRRAAARQHHAHARPVGRPAGAQNRPRGRRSRRPALAAQAEAVSGSASGRVSRDMALRHAFCDRLSVSATPA